MSGEAFGLSEAVDAHGAAGPDVVINPLSVYSAQSSGQLSGTYNYSAYVYVRQNGQDWANNRTNYAWEARLLMSGGGAYNNSQDQWWGFYVGGGLHAAGNFRLTYDQRLNTNRLLGSGTFWMSHDANGYRSGFQNSVTINTAHGSVGSGNSGDAWVDADRIPKVPGKPPTPVYISATPLLINYSFANPSDNGGSALTTFNHQSATDQNFTQNVKNWNDGDTPGQASALTPGTPHWIRYRAVNSIGAGPWSNALPQTTLPAVAPGFTVAATPSGTGATLTFSPPGGVTGVRKYVWERRMAGTTTPVASGETATTIEDVGGLTPGVRYEWRAAAWIDQYESPWTGWTGLTQPKPNTNPGDYFDGNNTDTPDINYVWSGTANNSISAAQAVQPQGWNVLPAAGGAAVIARMLSDGVGTYVARVTFTADVTAAGSRFGQSDFHLYRTDVTPNAPYVGTIRVKPSRATRMAGELAWLDASGAVLSYTVGTGAVMTVGAWNLLTVSGVAPAGAEFAAMRATDVAGTGWVKWQGGDLIELDAVMISLNEEFPYFDGDTLDTPEFIYEWDGAPHASVSTRTPVSQAGPGTLGEVPDLLATAGCTVPPAPPRPPNIPSDCIVDVGVWRLYYVHIPSINVSDWLSTVLTLHVKSGSVSASQVRIRFYPNPFSLDASQIDRNSWCAEQIIAYLPAHTVLTLDGVSQRAWAEVNGGSALSADHLLYGTGGTPATWPILSCGISYLVSLEVPINAPEGNIDVEAFATTRG